MKRLYFVIGILYAALSASSQSTLYGLTSQNGNYYGGTIFSAPTTTDFVRDLHDFNVPSLSGVSPYYVTPIQATNGKIYGTTYQGGANNAGTIFSYDPTSGLAKDEYDFQQGTYQGLPQATGSGCKPITGLVEFSGLLYGVTNQWSDNDNTNDSDYSYTLVASIYSFDISTGIYTRLISLNDVEAAQGGSTPIVGQDNELYGTFGQTSLNNSNYGSIYSFDPVTDNYSSYQLDGTNGKYPTGSLVQAADGTMYGLTGAGGTDEDGVLYSYVPGGAYNAIFSFTGTSGAYPGSAPTGGLILIGNTLYGVTYFGGANNQGVFFSYDLSGGGYSKLEDFSGASTGYYPSGSLSYDATNGLIYGVCVDGSNGDGEIFTYNPSDPTSFTPVYNGYPGNMNAPLTAPLLASNGLLYGTSQFGGGANSSFSNGNLYSFDPSTNNYNDVIDFGESNTGAYPNTGFIQADDGNLYSTTPAGGANGYGTLFSYNNISNVYNDIVDLSGTTGSSPGNYPMGNLVQASNELLYGVTYNGGANNIGCIFTYNIYATANAYQDIFDFAVGGGQNPAGGLIQARDGNLYGTTEAGGTNGSGTIYQLSTMTASTPNTVYNIQGGSMGNLPVGSLVQANNGLLYGVTARGGNASNYGTIFSFDPVSNNYNVVYTFDGTDGAFPGSGLYLSQSGILYGVTLLGGSNNQGVLYSLDPSSNTYTPLYSCTSSSGIFPTGTPVADANGILYGGTESGGAYGNGVIYSYNTNTQSYADLYDLYGPSTGSNIGGSLFLPSTVWTAGDGTTDWFDNGNWTLGAPSCSLSAIIPPASQTNNISPDINSSGASADVVTIATGGSLTIETGYQLSVCGNLVNNGSSSLGAGVISSSGSTAQVIYGNNVVGNLSVNNSSGVTIDPNSSVSVSGAVTLASGTLTTNGNLTITSSSSTQVGTIDNFSGTNSGTISGTVSVQRYYDASAAASSYNQHFMGSPIDQVPLSQFGASGTPGYVIPTSPSSSDPCDETQTAAGSPSGTVYAMNEANPAAAVCGLAEWDCVTSGNAVDGEGYSVVETGAGTITLTGNPNLLSSYTLPGLTNSNWTNPSYQGYIYGSGWWLLSNPYMATLNISSNGSGFDPQVQVWETEYGSAGSFQPFIAGDDATVAAFQAFMVHVTTPGTTPDYTIYSTDESLTATQFWRSANQNELVVTVLNDTTHLTDVTTVAFNKAATAKFDPQYDANKFQGALYRHTLYTLCVDSQWMAINTLPPASGVTEVPMGFEPGVSGNYTMSFAGLSGFEPNTTITLIDKLTKTSYDVSKGNYKFTANANDNWNRFTLVFNTASTTGINGVQDENTIPIWSYQNKVSVDFSLLANVKATITIYDLLGQVISTENYEGSDIYNKMLDNMNAGFVIVKVMNGDQVATKTVFITNAK